MLAMNFEIYSDLRMQWNLIRWTDATGSVIGSISMRKLASAWVDHKIIYYFAIVNPHVIVLWDLTILNIIDYLGNISNTLLKKLMVGVFFFNQILVLTITAKTTHKGILLCIAYEWVAVTFRFKQILIIFSSSLLCKGFRNKY